VYGFTFCFDSSPLGGARGCASGIAELLLLDLSSCVRPQRNSSLCGLNMDLGGPRTDNSVVERRNFRRSCDLPMGIPTRISALLGMRGALDSKQPGPFPFRNLSALRAL